MLQPAGEDLFAYDNFFFKMRGGVFLEMGALDGFTFSNTLLFERYLGWRVCLLFNRACLV